MAGTVATTVCAPADVLKSRFQNSATKDGKRKVSFNYINHKALANLKRVEPIALHITNFEDRRARFFDERVDARLVETCSKHNSHVPLHGTASATYWICLFSGLRYELIIEIPYLRIIAFLCGALL